MKIQETTEKIINFLIENCYIDYDNIENIENLNLGINLIISELIKDLTD